MVELGGDVGINSVVRSLIPVVPAAYHRPNRCLCSVERTVISPRQYV